MRVQYHLYISGDVQGVGLRYNLSRQARLLELVGWIKNLFDGRVEVIIQGEEESVNKIIDWLKNKAYRQEVKSIEIKKEKLSGNFHSFEISY